MLTTRHFNAIQSRIASGILSGCGFGMINGCYVRNVDNQIHTIEFQKHSMGGTYTINLGFHYDFIVACREFRPKNPTLFDMLDCALRSRLDKAKKGETEWYGYGRDESECERTLRMVS